MEKSRQPIETPFPKEPDPGYVAANKEVPDGELMSAKRSGPGDFIQWRATPRSKGRKLEHLKDAPVHTEKRSDIAPRNP